jgi:lysyl-tRNA synthetase class 2
MSLNGSSQIGKPGLAGRAINMTSPDPRFRPTASLEALRFRSRLLARIRHFFESRDFIHVETPLVSKDTVVDRHIDPIPIPASNFIDNDANKNQTVFLQTSPEFAMKRLVASGATAIYQICKAFRQGESGKRHNPEFTMLEWYRVGDDLSAGMNLLAEFAQAILGCQSIQKQTYRDAFLKHANVDPFRDDVATFRRMLNANGVDWSFLSGSDDRDAWLNLIMCEMVEPKLGNENPVIIFDWPESQAALAQVRETPDGWRVAERFELYLNGIELANGYHELLDANELKQRNAKVNQQRIEDGSVALPESSYLLEAMESGLPDCAGVAMGVDRLAMVLLDKESISEVIAFPFKRA